LHVGDDEVEIAVAVEVRRAHFTRLVVLGRQALGRHVDENSTVVAIELILAFVGDSDV
jgi:hypothetical protein